MDLNVIERLNRQFHGEVHVGWGDKQHSHAFLMFEALSNGLSTEQLGKFTIEEYGLRDIPRLLIELHTELLEGCTDDGEVLDIFKEEYEALSSQIVTVEEYFNYAKKLGWNLQDTVEIAAHHAFPSLDLEILGGSSYTTGLQCYLLCNHRYLDPRFSNDTFSGFII